MLFRDVIKLIWLESFINDIGDLEENEIEREVFANKKSVRASEFYQAMAIGLRPEIMFEIRASEYLDERSLIWENRKYDIIRTYSKNGEMLELICNGITGQHVKGDARLDGQTTLDSDVLLKGSDL